MRARCQLPRPDPKHKLAAVLARGAALALCAGSAACFQPNAIAATPPPSAPTSAATDALPVLIIGRKEIRDYRVAGVEPDGLSIRHESRTDKVPFERVPRELWKIFNRDFRDVDKHRERLEQIERDTAEQWQAYLARRAAGATMAAAATPRLAIPRVFVKPVFAYPADARAEPGTQREVLAAHVRWAQTRYLVMLGGRDTFRIAPGGPFVARLPQKRAEFAAMTQKAWHITQALMEQDGVDRYTCPFVYLIILSGTNTTIRGEGGTLNGGINTGGGIVIFTEDRLRDPTFQCGVQHELGHGFGLSHVDACGYDMATNRSIMSYNKAYHTRGFFPSATPGILIPEDVRVLAMNHRAFPELTFEPPRDVPAGYRLSGKTVFIPGANLPGFPAYAGPANGLYSD